MALINTSFNAIQISLCQQCIYMKSYLPGVNIAALSVNLRLKGPPDVGVGGCRSGGGLVAIAL